MPYYSTRHPDACHLNIYDTSTGALVPRVVAVDTDRGYVVQLERKQVQVERTRYDEIDLRHDGRIVPNRETERKEVVPRYRFERVTRFGQFYVEDVRTGERNPPGETPPPSRLPDSREAASLLRTHKHMREAREFGRKTQEMWDQDYKDRDPKEVLAEEAAPHAERVERTTAVRKLDVMPYLSSPRARKLVQVELSGTVIEYRQFEDGSREFDPRTMTKEDVDNIIKNGPPQEQEDRGARRTAFVMFAGKQVRCRLDEIEGREDIKRRWAKVLDMLADRHIWEFGILIGPTLLMNVSAASAKLRPDMQPHEIEYALRHPPEPRTMLMAYIGVNPDLVAGVEVPDMERRLNEIVGNDLFGREGQIASLDWRGLPE